MVAWGLVTTVNWRKVLKLEPMQFLDTMGMCTKNDLSQLQLYTVVIWFWNLAIKFLCRKKQAQSNKIKFHIGKFKLITRYFLNMNLKN